MAAVDVSVKSDLSPERAWALASDLSRFDEWLTIFGGWKSPVPDEIDVDTQVSSLIKVKGFRNVIHWTVTDYDEPRLIALSGTGRGGVNIDLAMKVDEIADMVVFLLSSRSGVVTGSVIDWDQAVVGGSD